MESEQARPRATERRSHPRWEVAYPATLRIEESHVFGTIENISRGGARVSVQRDVALAIGERALLMSQGAFVGAYDVRTIGGSGRRWRFSFEHGPIAFDGGDRPAAPLLMTEPELARTRAAIWRGLAGVLDGPDAEAAVAKADDLEIRALRAHRR